MNALTIPVPPAPILENALGYEGDARWMGAWWEPCGDEVVVSDGRVAKTGHWEGFLLYTRHHPVAVQLQPYDLGSSEDIAHDILLIDRDERKAFVSSVREGAQFLGEQWPKSEPIRLTEAQWTELVQEIFKEMLAMPAPSAEAINQSFQQYEAHLAALHTWLNQN